MAETVRRHTLSLKRKIEVIEAVEKQPGKKRVTLADEFQIRPSTLTTLMKEKEKYKRQFYSGTVGNPDQHKRYRPAKHEQVDKQLLTWFNRARSEGFPVNGPTLKNKAEEISEMLGIQNWKCSEGWLHRWKKRHGITLKTANSNRVSVIEKPEHEPMESLAESVNQGYSSVDGVEQGSVDQPTNDRWVNDVFLRTLEWYEPRNIFNLGVSALFWRLLPTKAAYFNGDKCCGGNKSKERLTLMLCCNMDGSEKTPLWVVGKLKNPRSLQGVKAMPVQYRANSRAWLTGEIFHEWLQSFDAMMAKQNRKVLLVLDKRPTQEIPALRATEILLLLENSSFRLHPCDHGITENLKAHYRKLKVLKLMAHTNGRGTAKDYQFSLADAVCTLKCAWDKVTPFTISCCFRKACFKVGEMSISADDVMGQHEHTEDEALEVLLSRVFQEWNVLPQEYFNIDKDVATEPSETSVSGDFKPYQSTSSASSQTSMCDFEDDGDDDCRELKEKVSSKTVLDCVQTIQTFCLQMGCSDSVTNSFNTFQQALVRHLACAGYQTKITQFFTKSRQLEVKPRMLDVYEHRCGEDKDNLNENLTDGAWVETEQAIENVEDDIVVKMENVDSDSECAQ